MCYNTAVRGLEESNSASGGVRLCSLCKAFLMASMTGGKHAGYCCPAGEAGKLCTFKKGERRCAYCWLRRIEIESAVDGLMQKMVAGKPS